MIEDFVIFSLAKKLKEKGFDCNEPFAMYNELGIFHPLYTSCDETLENCIFGNRGYYDYDDFDEYDCACPTISQALKWLREEKKIHIEFVAAAYGYNYIVSDTPEKGGTDRHCSAIKYEGPNDGGAWDKYEEAALAGIEYVIDNLI
jgi:hypothetical protein